MFSSERDLCVAHKLCIVADLLLELLILGLECIKLGEIIQSLAEKVSDTGAEPLKRPDNRTGGSRDRRGIAADAAVHRGENAQQNDDCRTDQERRADL